MRFLGWQEWLVCAACVSWILLAWWLGRQCYRVVAFSSEGRQAVTLEATNLVMLSSSLICWPLAVVLFEMGLRMGQGLHPILSLLFLLPTWVACLHLGVGICLLSWVWRRRHLGFADAAEMMLERFQAGSLRQGALLVWGLLGSLVFIQLTDLRLRMPTAEDLAFQAPSDSSDTMEWVQRGIQGSGQESRSEPAADTGRPFSPWEASGSPSGPGQGE